MKLSFDKCWSILPLIVMPLLVSLACQQLQPNGPSAGSQTPEGITSTDTPLEQENRTFDAEVTFGPGPINHPDTTTGLSDLSSYRATLTLTFEGKNAGQPYNLSKTYVTTVSKDPAFRQLTIQKTGELQDVSSLFTVDVDGTSYEKRGEDACLATATAQGDSPSSRLEAASLLIGVMGADEADPETVNGVPSRHYTFDERALVQPNQGKSTGEMWVATDGAYIVRYSLTTTGTAEYFGEGIEGSVTWVYDLTEINQPFTIELPQDCPPGIIRAPLMQDAVNIINLPGLLSFETTFSIPEVVALYQKEIPDLGWKQAQDPVVNDASAMLLFTLADETMIIVASSDAQTSHVSIMVTRE